MTTKSYNLCSKDLTNPFASNPPITILLKGFPSTDSIQRFLARWGEELGIRNVPDKVRLIAVESDEKPTRDRRGKIFHLHTPESRQKISASMKKLVETRGFSEAHRKNISNAQRRKHLETQKRLEKLDALEKQMEEERRQKANRLF